MTRRYVLAVLLIVASFTAITVVQAQEEFPSDNDVNAIAKKLYCPVCPNTPLDVCETKACQDWRAEIKDQLADGWSEEQILNYFVVQYGERVLAEPERSGFTALVWLLPVIAVLLGLVVVSQALRSWRTARLVQTLPAPPETEVSPETLAKIEKELRELA
jgi:cytochrome c-type biogenesis protein CcmH